MHVHLKNMPRLHLADLLRRRKTTLKQFIDESGVQTYEGLVNRCVRMGVQPPSDIEFKAIKPVVVTSPQDGVIVLEPPPVVDEISGRKIDPDAPVTLPGVETVFDVPPTTDVRTQEEPTIVTKKRRKKKDNQQPVGDPEDVLDTFLGDPEDG